MSETEKFIAWEKASRDTIDVKRIYIDIVDDLVTGILLSQIMYWYLPNKEGKSKLTILRDGRWWLAKLREDWWEECRITPKQFDRAAANLEGLKLIESAVFNVNGISTKHVWLNMENVLQRVKAVLPKGQFTPLVNSPKVNSPLPQRSSAYKESETTKEDKEQNLPLSEDLFSDLPESKGKTKKPIGVKESTSDPRHNPAKLAIVKAYNEKNGVDYYWNGREGKKMSEFLNLHPTWSIETVLKCINNRFDSEENHSEEPHEWINKLGKYASGPLNQYGKPKSSSNGFHNGQQSHTNGSGTTGHLLDHLPSIEQIQERRKADDERLRLRREARQ